MTRHEDALGVVRLRKVDPIVDSVRVAAAVDVRELIPGGLDVASPVRFSSDVWELRGHASWRSKAGLQTRLDFSGISPYWRTAAKEWVLLCLDPNLATQWAPEDPIATTWPETQEPIKLVTAQGNLKALRAGLEVLTRYDLVEPDEDGWMRVWVLMRQPQDREEKRNTTSLSPGTLRMRVQQLRSLWSVRSIIGRHTMLGTAPFGEIESTELAGSGGRPRRNLRRPHEDVGLCLGYVAWVFDNLADDIVQHARWWSESVLPPDQCPSSKADGYEAMTSLLHEIVSATGELPGVLSKGNSKPSLAHAALARLLGQYDPDVAYLWGRYALRRFPNTPIVVDGGNPCPFPLRQFDHVDGSGALTWAPRLLDTRDELRWWASALVYYALFYIASTCGLRDLDLDCLPIGCVRHEVRHRPTGEAYEVITMRGYKQKNRMAPVPTEWKVSERIARIVGIVEQLHEIYGIAPSRNDHTGERRLFDSKLITASDRGMRDSVHLDLSWMNWITEGARRLHDRGVVERSLEGVTKLTVPMVRITALQAYASRQLGSALVAQFGQWSNQAVALGYHGDVFKLMHLADPEDARELEQEHAGRTLVRAARGIDELRGRGSPRLRQVLESAGLELSNPAPLSTSRLKRLGKQNPNIRTGPYTICVYSAATALCGGDGAADFRLCRPYECRNSVMTTGDRARVELRRRDELRMSPILRRSAEKLAAGMPEIVEEFRQQADDELLKIVVSELDDYVAEALSGEGGAE